MPGAADRCVASRQPDDLGELRTAGEDDAFRGDRAAIGGDAPNAVPSDIEADEPRVLDDADIGVDERCGVGEHVARRVDVSVLGGVRRPERDTLRHPGGHGVESVRVEPLDVETEAALHRDALVRRGDLGDGEARHQIALRDEAGVEGVAVPLALVERLAPPAEAHRPLGAALRTNHAGSAAAGALAERGCLDEDDVVEALVAKEAGAPAADRAAADDHGVRATRKLVARGHPATLPETEPSVNKASTGRLRHAVMATGSSADGSVTTIRRTPTRRACSATRRTTSPPIPLPCHSSSTETSMSADSWSCSCRMQRAAPMPCPSMGLTATSAWWLWWWLWMRKRTSASLIVLMARLPCAWNATDARKHRFALAYSRLCTPGHRLGGSID